MSINLDDILIWIDPSKSDIVGVMGENIHIRSVYINDKDDSENNCVVVIDRTLFIRLLSLWLDRKADYCASWNEYCGIMGHFYPEEIACEGTTNIIVGFDPDKGDEGEYIYQDVPLIQIIKIDEHCDMEHG